jgi:hypothetical protein
LPNEKRNKNKLVGDLILYKYPVTIANHHLSVQLDDVVEAPHRAREPHVNGDFRGVPKNQIFDKGYRYIFLEVAMEVDYFLICFFIFKGLASINGCKRLGTRGRSLSKSGYFNGL